MATSRSTSRLIVAGIAVVDDFYFTTHLPAPEESVQANRFDSASGGKAANQAAAAALAGFEASLVAVVGSDAPGKDVLNAVARTGADVSTCRRESTQATGRSAIVVQSDGRQQIATWPGVSVDLTVEDLRVALKASEEGSWVSLQGEVPHLTAELVGVAKEMGARVILNPSPSEGFQREFPWSDIDVAVVNRIEKEQLGTALDSVGTLIETRGAEGVSLRVAGQDPVAIAAPTVKVVDTTGAGDAFAGVLAGSLASGRSLELSVAWAITAAGIAVQRERCIPSYPTKEEILAVLGREGLS